MMISNPFPIEKSQPTSNQRQKRNEPLMPNIESNRDSPRNSKIWKSAETELIGGTNLKMAGSSAAAINLTVSCCQFVSDQTRVE
jgi:hypothetical protein